MAKLSNAALYLIAASMLIGLLYYGRAVFAPVAFALFIIMLVWPVQRGLASALNHSLALLISFVLVLGVLLGFGWLIAWTVGQVGRRIANDATSYQFIYQQFQAWLEAHGVAVSVLWSDNFSMTTTLRMLQAVSLQLRNTFSFWLIAVVYVLLGLAEINEFGARINALGNQQAAARFLRASKAAASKIRFYMLLRAAMSLATGFCVWLLSRLLGLPFAETWGFVAFILNFIPFLGPLIATLLITAFAFTHWGNWQWGLFIFVGLNAIQAIIGSVIEPRLTGRTLALSPLATLFSVFAWGAIWGVFGAFIGVPLTIVILTFCAHHVKTSPIAELFGFPRATSDPVGSH
ncbi:hypothetical protein Brsp05_03970 [Brucella sp. NBRC 12953]|uniref:AI-2E family transporter n=1 Tax=Brucella sp. NBRC 12953 TaxID=3075481 RepID=UPI00309C2B68